LPADDTNSSVWSSIPEFEHLVAVGPKAVPIVLDEIAWNIDDPHAVFLYNSLEKDPEYKVDANLDQQEQATAILSNFIRGRIIRNALLDWAEYCSFVNSSTSTSYTSCEDHENLVKIGAAIFPHLMIR
ncbi:hypothetical protein QBC38DRAFT_348218, partial [Podospora fimiseda]